MGFWTLSIVRNSEFPSYLEFQTMNKDQKPSDSECYTPSSEPFILSLTVVFHEDLQLKFRGIRLLFLKETYISSLQQVKSI
jgi:hypothetical protein